MSITQFGPSVQNLSIGLSAVKRQLQRRIVCTLKESEIDTKYGIKLHEGIVCIKIKADGLLTDPTGQQLRNSLCYVKSQMLFKRA